MKNAGGLLCKLMLCILCSPVIGHQLSGQEKVNFSVGFGFMELLNAGVRFQYKQAQLGISVGTLPLKDEISFSVSGDLYYHFGGLSGLSERRPWYGKIGLNYFRDETKEMIDKYLFLNMRIGRDFNISKKFGIGLDGGILIPIQHDEVEKNPSDAWDLNIDIPIWPSIGIVLFYRI